MSQRRIVGLRTWKNGIRMDDFDVYTLRCCRDWPCHVMIAVNYRGSCGICGKSPEFVAEKYVSPVKVVDCGV